MRLRDNVSLDRQHSMKLEMLLAEKNPVERYITGAEEHVVAMGSSLGGEDRGECERRNDALLDAFESIHRIFDIAEACADTQGVEAALRGGPRECNLRTGSIKRLDEH